MYCSISGVIPKEAVVARTSGLVFEKALVEKALKVEDKCPVTGAPLRLDDLIVIQANKLTPPAAATVSSVPNLLQALQDQWGETVLETFNLRQQLDATRKELAHALYQHDAACRVIARLVRERDEAQQLLQAFRAGNGSHATSSTSVPPPAPPAQPAPSSTSEQMDVVGQEEIGVSEAVVEKMTALCKSLSSKRKQRKPAEQLLSKDDMMLLEEQASYRPHQESALRAVALQGSSVITGGDDRSIVFSDVNTGRLQRKLTGHTGSVNVLAASAEEGGFVVSGSADQTIRMWAPSSNGAYTERWCYNRQRSSIAGLSLHPSGSYVASVGGNGAWHLLDVEQGACLVSVAGDAGQEYTSSCFHPDGLLLVASTAAGEMKVWDVRVQKNVVNLVVPDGDRAVIHASNFSENGYYAAAGYGNGVARVWDLRKQVVSKAFELGRAPVTAVQFDYSGVYLALGGGETQGRSLHVKVVKDWSSSVTVPTAHGKQVTGLAWTEHAQSLVSVSADHTVKIFSKRA